MIWALAGCVGRWPFINEPPELVSVNDVPYSQWQQIQLPPVDAGTEVTLTVVAEDPEGDRFEIWFPGAQGTVNFDPDDRSGTIAAPAESPLGYVTLVLRDDRDPPVSQSYELYFGYSSSGTGYYGYYGYGYQTGETGDTGQ